MEENNFIGLLRDRLGKPLPGEKAQMIMAASSRRPGKFILKQNAELRLSSVMILLFREEAHWKLPLIKRQVYNGVHSGQMALPGGRMEEKDSDRIKTAIRETEEETGVNLTKVEIIGKLTELRIQASGNSVLPVVAYLPEIPVFEPDPGEVAALHIVSLDHLLNDNNRKETVIQVNERYQVEAPYFDVENQVVWGATAMILSEFLYIVKMMTGK